MAIPINITKESIFEAANYVKENGIPDKNKSTVYELVLDSGEKYPPKYIIAIADYLVNNVEVSTKEYNAVEAKRYLESLNFVVETKQEKFELVITDDNILSTEENFTTDNIGLGDNYKPLDVYFKKHSGEVLRRKYNKGERRNSNQTMPRLAFQLFERSILALTVEEKENFTVCQYTPNSEIIRGIFTSVEEFKKHRNTIEYLIYTYDSGKQFVIYSWNIFSTIFFVQECLKRFGEEGDQFILTYREKDKKESIQPENEEIIAEEQVMEFKSYMNPYSNDLIESKNIIFRGAPGTGKSYLAKEIAADIISNGYFDDYALLSDEQKNQIEFVQFHPSYDYTDFVEGLRPKINDDGSMGFELRDGMFKSFVKKAKRNFESSQNSQEIIEKKTSVFKPEIKHEKLKPFIFIIDEINRGEISKILGELFFAIDPGYRGQAGVISTQYANLHDNPNEKFFIPENVYIIGTMNDIDRSVDSFDFAMRRRFRFIEIKSDERLEMLDSLGEDKEEAICRMVSLNNEISKVEELNDNYHIGASYFLKLKTLNSHQLWTDYISPLLQDYVRGMYDEESILKKFKVAYNRTKPEIGDKNDTTQG